MNSLTILELRLSNLKRSCVPGFTRRYGVNTLVWFERHDSVEVAIRREKQFKEWKRGWKFNLIERDDPRWLDLYPNLSP